jgi:UDP-glucose 4-epimerase
VPAAVNDIPYGVNPWLAEKQPECPYYGLEHGLFEPSTPHPRYIVTGGAGFIGSHLVRRLAAELGPGQVKVVDSFLTGQIARFQRPNGSWVINPQRDVCALDLRVLPHATKYLRGADYVYHLAGVPASATSTPHPLAVLQDNLLVSTNTLRACRVNNVTNYIYASSACSPLQHTQRQEGLHDMADPFAAETNYVHSKLLGEHEAALARSSGFNVALVRLPSMYGAGACGSTIGHDSTRGVILSLLCDGANSTGRRVMVSGAPNDTVGDLVYVDDAVDALLLVQDKGMNKGLLHVGTGQTFTLDQLAKMVAEVLGSSTHTQVQYTASLSGTGMLGSTCGSLADIKHGQSLLGWQPRHSLQQGLAATLEAIRKEENKPRVLVVLFGQPRGGELAWKSIHRHLMLPNNAHLATLLTPVGGRDAGNASTMLEAMAQWVWRVPEPADGDWGVWMDEAAALCPHSSGPQWSDLCKGARRGAHWAGGFKKCPNHNTMSGVVLVYRWLASQKVMALNLHQQYDYIVYSRPDYLHLCEHHLMVNTSATHIGVPLGQEWGGYCDRHLVGTSSTVLKAINITQELTCNGEQYENMTRNGAIRNNESLQARLWAHMGLPVWRFPLTMFTVRSPGDPSSFKASEGTSTPDLAPFGLKVKYMAEYNASVAACGLDNITHSLELLEQHQVPLFS